MILDQLIPPFVVFNIIPWPAMNPTLESTKWILLKCAIVFTSILLIVFKDDGAI